MTIRYPLQRPRRQPPRVRQRPSSRWQRDLFARNRVVSWSTYSESNAPLCARPPHRSCQAPTVCPAGRTGCCFEQTSGKGNPSPPYAKIIGNPSRLVNRIIDCRVKAQAHNLLSYRAISLRWVVRRGNPVRPLPIPPIQVVLHFLLDATLDESHVLCVAVPC